MERREFLKTIGVVTAGISMVPGQVWSGGNSKNTSLNGKKPTVHCAFIYPPSKELHEEGYYSWPGSGFNAEGKQSQYTQELRNMEKSLGINLQINQKPLNTSSDVSSYIQETKQNKPDGLLLIPFKKGHWPQVIKIIDETKIPTIILATLGVLLNPHIRDVKYRPGVYMISSLDNLKAVENGLKLIHAGRRMQDSRIINITGSETIESKVPHIGTSVLTIPHQRFYDKYKEIKADSEVQKLANHYTKSAVDIVEPNQEDIVNAARAYFAFKNLLAEEHADAIMMNCLPGLKHPHQHVPPCMGFMQLRDEGIPMGCESDLDATLTMMLEQFLFDRPGFQHNPAVDTEKNHYFGAHCTAPSKMLGPDQPAEPYALMSHAEAGWGVVPRVLMRKDQDVTIAKYLSSKKGEQPQLLLYSGKTVECPPIPPTGGCRTNILTTINELDDIAQLKGHHLCMIYGNFVNEFKTFSQLYDIEVVV